MGTHRPVILEVLSYKLKNRSFLSSPKLKYTDYTLSKDCSPSLLTAREQHIFITDEASHNHFSFASTGFGLSPQCLATMLNEDQLKSCTDSSGGKNYRRSYPAASLIAVVAL